MIRSSACLSANDLSIVCRVRKSPYTTNPKFEDAMEMTCTMRHWCPDRASSVPKRRLSQKSTVSTSSCPGIESSCEVASDPRHSGPELVLTPMVISPMAKSKAVSPLPRRNSIHNVISNGMLDGAQRPIYIHLSDILIVESIQPKKQQRCYSLRITTQSSGFYVFDNLNLNSRDVLLAFLKINIASERMIETKENKPDDISVPSITSASSSRSMDVDKLTTERMKHSSERESFTERMTRRTSRLAVLLSEFCGSITDSACCKGRSTSAEGDDEVRDLPSITPTSAASRRSIKLNKGDLEEEESTVSSVKARRMKDVRNKKQRSPSATLSPSALTIGVRSKLSSAEKTDLQRGKLKETLRASQFPSGLSVEENPASEDHEDQQ
ncbi:hypothetical protein ACA910_003748 [Epithemia clementina (nom. ined.)]